MRHDIKTAKVSNELDILHWKLDEVAESFGHKVTRIFPIWLMLVDGRVMGWWHLHQHMVIYPNLHPDLTPRETGEIGWTFMPKLKEIYGDPLMATHKPDAFPDSIMAKIGLEKFPFGLYRFKA